MTPTKTTQRPFPIEIQDGIYVDSPEQLAMAIIRTSNEQLKSSQIQDSEDLEDFQISCDALNLSRANWRLREELDVENDSDLGHLPAQLSEIICRKRNYDPDEFESAKLATRKRARFPFGLDPLRWAYTRAKRQTLQLLAPGVAGSEVAGEIAGIARELQKLTVDDPILLPVEQLRSLLGRRKIVVSGTLLRLVDAGVLSFVNSDYHTGRSREFRFEGIEGTHFRFKGVTDSVG